LEWRLLPYVASSGEGDGIDQEGASPELKQNENQALVACIAALFHVAARFGLTGFLAAGR
jgi:hypothetical protein